MASPVYLRFADALQKYGVERDILTRAIRHGLVRAIKVNGHIAVAEEDVRKLRDANGEPTTELPQYIPLAEAARRYGIPEETLKRAVESGTIRAVQLGEEVAVAEQDIQSVSIDRDALWQQASKWEGQVIGIEEAQELYGLNKQSIYRWIAKGYIRVVKDIRGGGRGRKRLLNKADVVYIALLKEKLGTRRGRRLLTPETLPPHIASTS